ncbi:hypothetical protein ACFSCW_13705 [Sphingomonas tabacisoli]|uniref:Uncharacterized protein n=1 Tax=Sphingomonas tabacisoli TaxID=2249466 RepID=A0ABW4I6K9_9SPHN
MRALLRRVAFTKAARGQPGRLPDVIYLGYDDRDNVSSMRSAMLARLERGALDTL